MGPSVSQIVQQIFNTSPSGGGSNAPTNTALPVISGIVEIGQTLSVTTGTWTGLGITYTYQWKRNGSSIGSATNNTYVLVSADYGNPITCTVTATNAGGATPATSAATVNVIGPTMSIVQTKLITQTAGGTATMIFDTTPTQGNLMTIIVGCSDEGTFNAPVGWTLVQNTDIAGQNFSFACYCKIAGASEPNSYAFTSTPFTPTFTYCVGFETTPGGFGIGGSPVTVENTGLAVQTLDAGSTTVNAAAGDLALVAMMASGIFGGSGIPSFGSGFANPQDGLATTREFHVARQIMASANSALNCTITWTTARNAGGFIVVLKR